MFCFVVLNQVVNKEEYFVLRDGVEEAHQVVVVHHEVNVAGSLIEELVKLLE